MGAGIKGMMIGGAAGLAGGAAASAVSGVGFFANAAMGALGGAAGGFVGGSLNAWANGNNFGDGLLKGLSGAGIGALAGGLIGGVIGGIGATAHHGNFWTGKGYILKSTISSLPKVNETTGPVEFSDESAHEFSDDYLPEPEGLRYLNANSPRPFGYVLH